MALQPIDWACIVGFFVLSLVIGVAVSKRAGRSSSEFFLSGRSMPWWLLGVGMVATTFSTDTPNLVTDIVRQNGVAGNWSWWAFLLTGMLTVFVYAKLWRRSGMLTDIEFYEIRYSGKPAAFLRGFRAVYLGVFFNVVIMGAVSLAAIKIGGVLLNISPEMTIVLAAAITALYSMLGGLRSVLITDFIQFSIAMIGAVIAAYIALNLPEVGGLTNLLAHPNVQGKLGMLPRMNDLDILIPVLIIPLAVQWWSVWYPGAEPGGGGYLVQRMLSAKNERHAMGATLFFNAAHYALRPWPWIIVALCSLVVFPDLASMHARFPHLAPEIVKHDLGYPAMLSFLPSGILGLVIASLIAAYMSTISTHLNWGSSYIVNDLYKRFLKPDASERTLVLVGRISTVALMVLASLLALFLQNAFQAFNIILQIGAGTGLIFILRWFWWRINAFSELAGMVVSFIVALYFELIYQGNMADWQRLLLGIVITTVAWLAVTFVTRPTSKETLHRFCALVRPGGPGWEKVLQDAKAEGVSIAGAGEAWEVPLGILCMVMGCFAVYGALFATGFWIYGRIFAATILTLVAILATVFLVKTWGKLRTDE